MEKLKKSIIDTSILFNIICSEHPQTVPLLGGSGYPLKTVLFSLVYVVNSMIARDK